VRSLAVDGVDQLARRVAERLGLTRGRRDPVAAERHRAADAPDPPAAPVPEPPTVPTVLAALAAEGWLCLENPPWPGGSPAMMEHIAIGPGGVFVIDSRAPAAPPDVTPVPPLPGAWAAPARSTLAARAGSVAALLQPGHRTAVRAVTCVDGHDGLARSASRGSAGRETAPAARGDLGTAGPGEFGSLAERAQHDGQIVVLSELATVLRASASASPPRLSPDDVVAVHALLGWHLLTPHLPDQLTTRALDAVELGSWDPSPHGLDPFARRRDHDRDGRPTLAPDVRQGAYPGLPPSRARGLNRDSVPRVPPRPVGPSHRAAGRHRRIRLLRLILAIVVVALLLLAVPALLHASDGHLGGGVKNLLLGAGPVVLQVVEASLVR
jgi:hypothetical protein